MTRRDWCLLFVLGTALLSWPLHVPGITTRGEAREAMVLRDMQREGHWILGYRLGVVASKPPFYHWLALAPAHVFGVTAAVARLPSALGALVLAAMTGRLGSVFGGRRAGWLAVGALAGTAAFWRSALDARVDMVFAAAVTTALVTFLVWYAERRTRPPVVAYLATAAAVLTKGPAGAVLPVLVVAVFLLWRRDAGVLRRLWSWPAALGSGGVVLGWYGLAYRAGGQEFLAVQLLRENVARFVGSGPFGRRRAHLLAHGKLVGAFLAQLFPWNLSLVEALRRWRRGGRLASTEQFLHLWWLITLGVFSLAAGKRSVYLLPLYPPVAALAGVALARVASPSARQLVLSTVLLLDVLALGLVQSSRGRQARRDLDLVRFGAVVRSTVPATTTLRAAPDLGEDDYVTLGWLLDRGFTRGGPACPAGSYVIGPDGGPAQGPVARASRQGRMIVLRQCPAS